VPWTVNVESSLHAGIGIKPDSGPYMLMHTKASTSQGGKDNIINTLSVNPVDWGRRLGYSDAETGLRKKEQKETYRVFNWVVLVFHHRGRRPEVSLDHASHD